ncbi:MAG: antibiotic biosynthesis monooxygenase [Chloroflexi bacterium]|nr:antibiotic biosynthesis monooxygenase [Chloroflexota bacterium]
MYAIFFKIRVRPGKKQKFVDFLKWDAQVSLDTEPCTLRFDVFEDADDENLVYFYEGYTDEPALAAHKANEPFQLFDTQIKDECIEAGEAMMPWTTSAWPPSE